MEEGYQEALEKITNDKKTSKMTIEEITNMVRDYIEFLHSMGYELDDNGEIVDSQGKKLILGNDDE